MGKAARRNNQAKMEAGILQLRIGKLTADEHPRTTNKQRKKAARPSMKLPVPKGSEPMSASDLHHVFEQSRRVQGEVDRGERPPGPVELMDEGLPAVKPVFAEALVDAVTSLARPRIHKP